MTSRDKLHLTALRGAKAHVAFRAVKGKRRDLDVATYFGACWRGAWWSHDFDPQFDLSEEAVLIDRRGFREICAQLHILETAEREANASATARTAEDI